MKNKWLILIFITILASFLRLYQLDKVPPGFHIDEVTVGYNAYSILETGRDENGNFLPVYIDSFGDFRPAGYFYLTMPAIKFLGLTEFAVRFPSALFGVLTVILLFFLTENIFKNRFIAFLSAFLLAISPWHIIITRATSETSVAIFLVTLGTYLFFVGTEKKKLWYFFFTFLAFFTSFYFYHTPRIFVPLLFIGLLILTWSKMGSRGLRQGTLFFLTICIGASLLLFLSGSGKSRFNQVSIFAHPGVQLRLDEQIREEFSGTNTILVRVFHNKLVNFGLEVLSNYGKHFSFDFLFTKGGLPIRYVVPEAGLLYLFELPFLLLAVLFIFREKDRLSLLPVWWLLVGPVAASLTFEDIPNVQRASFMLPSLQMLTAYGFYTAWKKGKGKNYRGVLVGWISLILFFSVFYFLHQYFIHQRAYRPWYRNYGFKELITEINKLSPAYQKIILTREPNDPYIYIFFYNQYNPQIAQKYLHSRSKEEWGFESYVFSPHKCPSQIKEKALDEGKNLFIDKGECKTMSYARILKTISREDKTPAFQILEVDKNLAEDYFKKQEQL